MCGIVDYINFVRGYKFTSDEAFYAVKKISYVIWVEKTRKILLLLFVTVTILI